MVIFSFDTIIETGHTQNRKNFGALDEADSFLDTRIPEGINFNLVRIIHSLEGRSWSGGQQQALFLAQGQAILGHDVLLMCQTGSELQTRAEQAGVKVLPHNYRKEMNPISIWGLSQALDRFRPDVINVHRAWAHTQWALVSLLKRFRGLIVTRRVLFRPDFNPLSTVKYRSAAIRGYIAVSEAVSERLQELGISSKRIRVVHPATDTDRFDPQKVIGAPDLDPGTVYLLFVANFHKNKGHFLLLDAFEKIANDFPSLTLLIVGHGTDAGTLPGKVANSPFHSRVRILGFRKDIPDLLAHSSIAVNASYEEGFSGFIREALSMGIPVAASDIPANREMAKIAPITLFPCGSADGLEAALRRQLRNLPGARQKRDLRAVAVNAFSVKSMVEATLAAYRHHIRNLR